MHDKSMEKNTSEINGQDWRSEVDGRKGRTRRVEGIRARHASRASAGPGVRHEL